MALDYVGVLLFVAAGQSLSWAVFKDSKLDAVEKIGLGLAASLTVPALVSAALNFAGVPFSQLTVYAVFVALTLAGLAWVKFGGNKR